MTGKKDCTVVVIKNILNISVPFLKFCISLENDQLLNHRFNPLIL